VSVINAASVAAFIKAARAATLAAQDELNAADARLGDGDTGVMLRRLFEALEAALPAAGTADSDLGLVFQPLAKASASTTGSSLGTLVTVAMMTLAKSTRGQADITWTGLAQLLDAVRDQLMARGGAKLGDKTILDSLDAVARTVEGMNDPHLMLDAARTAARQTLERFRRQPNRAGRARMFGDKTIGLDDPGMLALLRVVEALPG
jgi:dihydroxyacetone kinase